MVWMGTGVMAVVRILHGTAERGMALWIGLGLKLQVVEWMGMGIVILLSIWVGMGASVWKRVGIWMALGMGVSRGTVVQRGGGGGATTVPLPLARKMIGQKFRETTPSVFLTRKRGGRVLLEGKVGHGSKNCRNKTDRCSDKGVVLAGEEVGVV